MLVDDVIGHLVVAHLVNLHLHGIVLIAYVRTVHETRTHFVPVAIGITVIAPGILVVAFFVAIDGA